MLTPSSWTMLTHDTAMTIRRTRPVRVAAAPRA